jgi:hypothetical protein
MPDLKYLHRVLYILINGFFCLLFQVINSITLFLYCFSEETVLVLKSGFRSHTTILYNQYIVRCKHVLSHIVMSEQYILDMNSTLDTNKAVGPDIISNKMRIAVIVKISKSLCMLFIKSLFTYIGKRCTCKLLTV